MRYKEFADESSDPMVDMAKKRLDQASVQKDQQKLRVKQAQERKIRGDIQNKKRQVIKPNTGLI